jgi:hypothetical protein
MKRGLITLGLLLFLLGLVLLWLLARADAGALAQDRQVLSSGIIDLNCSRVIRSVTIPSRTMSEGDSQTLRVVLANDAGQDTCKTTVLLLAPDFYPTPPLTARPVVLAPGGEIVILAWVLSPRDTGSFAVAVSAGNQTVTTGITVTNVLGLTAGQARTLSYLSTILGPMLTAPWWYEQWQKRRKKRRESEAQEELAT